ncbi:hypothetical protein SEA_YABOI_199 [Streptomyces phage Yaboi]|jgi:hypothetical protein|uniref:Uncharacterized protein n=3 Tax=Streptomyces virus Yaboi TaxID=2846408 RepID=A0A385UI93_9CAUD|nr:hypothetical protein HWB86_gp123 [Streptomyces phage Yaboi]QAY08820.1 hypothetical protein SEA_GENIE2_194 [Streptomyces phage Genie2]QAY12810.1 hypothetical protein SEA_BOOMERJR_194 [Streptomyces phage BoomerJR]UVD40004.1 hypothetical protein SEA_STANIMAL_194 [Streptomyces phage Stanimal]WNM73746.1 hypothetical protein SEA_SOLLERTIA_195 [Streptomyces phage Sollertia]AYB70996.1 hypothetical protein SEA_YABOI_199 [Streptomyces phage Yaboi]
MKDDLIEISDEEFRAAYQRRLKALGITEQDLLRQAAAGNFDTHQIRMLWFTVGGWKNGKPVVMA